MQDRIGRLTTAAEHDERKNTEIQINGKKKDNYIHVLPKKLLDHEFPSK